MIYYLAIVIVTASIYYICNRSRNRVSKSLRNTMNMRAFKSALVFGVFSVVLIPFFLISFVLAILVTFFESEV